MRFNRRWALVAWAKPTAPDTRLDRRVRPIASLEAQPIASGVIDGPSMWHMDVSATEDGLLVYSSGTIGTMQLVWLDRSGKDASLPAENLSWVAARLPPQGDQAALEMDSGTGTADIFVLPKA